MMTPRSRRMATLAAVAAWVNMPASMAGATSSGQRAARAVTDTVWPHAYSRETAAYPFEPGTHGAAHLRAVRGKYWPPVRRIDQAYGDRNLVCSCPPPEAFES